MADSGSGVLLNRTSVMQTGVSVAGSYETREHLPASCDYNSGLSESSIEPYNHTMTKEINGQDYTLVGLNCIITQEFSLVSDLYSCLIMLLDFLR